MAEVLKPSPHIASETSAAFPAWSPTSVFGILQEKMVVYPGVDFKLKIDVRDEVAARIPAPILDRVISNMLNNACEANGFTGTVFVRVRAGERHYVIEIEDQGPGLPEGFKVSLGGSTKSDGRRVRGIGLYSAMEAIRAFGTLKLFKADLGRGTVVRLFIGDEI